MEKNYFVKIVASLVTVLLKVTLCLHVFTLYLQKTLAYLKLIH